MAKSSFGTYKGQSGNAPTMSSLSRHSISKSYEIPYAGDDAYDAAYDRMMADQMIRRSYEKANSRQVVDMDYNGYSGDYYDYN